VKGVCGMTAFLKANYLTGSLIIIL